MFFMIKINEINMKNKVIISEYKYPLKSNPIFNNIINNKNFKGNPIKLKYITVFFTSFNPINI